MKRSLSFAAVLLLLVGCEQMPPSNASQDVSNHLRSIGVIHYSPGPAITDFSPEAAMKRVEADKAMMDAFTKATSGLPLNEWETADERLATVVSQHENRQREIAQQIASTAMLRVWLPAADPSPAVRQAFAHHSLTMAREASPMMELIADGIEQAGEGMTQAEREEASRLAIEAHSARLARKSLCEGEGCDGPPASIVPDTGRSERQSIALARLQSMLE